MCGLLRSLIVRRALCDRSYPSDSIVHVERCVIVSSRRGDFDYCIVTSLRAGAVYDPNLRLTRIRIFWPPTTWWKADCFVEVSARL